MSTNKIIEIYTLKHPVTNEIKYVGKAVDSKRRLKSHIHDSKTRNTNLYQWMRPLLEIGLMPILEVIKVTDEANWINDEINAISEFRQKGCDLLNMAIGGNEPFCSKETRAENGRKNALAIHSDERRKRLWSLKKRLSVDLKYLEAHGSRDFAFMIRRKLSTRGIYFPVYT